MFTQVYFHKTRIAYDHHLQRALAEALPGGRFPRPIRDATADELSEFLKWDDWRVFGILAGGGGGEHGQRLVRRDHYREVYHTPETPTVDDLTKLDRVRKKLGTLVQAEGRAEKSWYKLDQPDIPVVSDNPGRAVLPLSEYSSVVKGLSPIRKVMLFARKEEVSEGRQLVLHVEGVDK